MRYIIPAATAITLVVGIAIGFALTATVFEAEAKPPPPGPQPVEEQNVDGSGYIAVHEQGTADVNVTNTSLPVNGTVDVGNLPALQDVNVTNAALPVVGNVEVTNLPTDDEGPSEFTHVRTAGITDTQIGEAMQAMTALSAEGWEYVPAPVFMDDNTGARWIVFVFRRPMSP